MHKKRVFLIVLDGLGVGAAPDAAAYGDTGSDTLGHIAQQANLDCPNLSRCGLGNMYVEDVPGIPKVAVAQASYGRLTEVSKGKDTTTGHWEMMGIVRDEASPVFPAGFPGEVIAKLTEISGQGVLCNKPASGTAIINELGNQHLQSGELIVYTSADSVLQIAAHEDVVPLEELYRICIEARKFLTGKWAVDRVIARPFTGPTDGVYSRTENRKDYSLLPPGPTALDEISSAGLEVIGVGKISDIFAGQGITQSYPDHTNDKLMDRVGQLQADTSWQGLAFCNLVDFDMLYGHRNNPAGFASALNIFDVWLGGFLEKLRPDELLILTADHGNDPTTPSTDHSREQVPFLAISQSTLQNGGSLIQAPPGFFHVGKTIMSQLNLGSKLPGECLL